MAPIDNNNLIFQILDWRASDIEDEEGNLKYIINLYGKTKDEKTVYLEINDFKPFFFVKIKSKWERNIHDIVDKIKEKIPVEFKDSLISYRIETANDFYGFTGGKTDKFIKLIFKNLTSLRRYERKFTQNMFYSCLRQQTNFKVYESNIPPFLRMMHIKDLRAVGWIAIPNEELEGYGSMNPTCNDINCKTKWKNISKIDDNSIAKFTIASFDIECTSGDGSFPQPDRETDQVIQIGITMSKYSEADCYYKHILCLGKTDDIEGSTVQWFEDEKELLLEFPKLIRKLNPDIITGYNINGFDFDYLKRRAEFLGIEIKFSRLSRLEGELTPYIDKTLESAAIGQSVFKYYDMTGRVIVDLMKVIQREYKLGSYKLDNVAAHFIKDTILDISFPEDNKIKIKTKNTYGLGLDQYIVFLYNDGIIEEKYKEGLKFKILELEKDTIIVEGKIEKEELIGKGYKLYWSQTKDDVGPQDIFRLQKGSSTDRAIVAKYCIQDCALCNKLMNKLQIINNNVGMANVCSVPLAFIFYRGQGIKIQSLVAKKCREKNHLIPVLEKKQKKGEKTEEQKMNERRDMGIEQFIDRLNNKNADIEEDEEDEVSYEGATVFNPSKGMYFEPVVVLDYASLYPNSMIMRNLSHECLVNNDKYDNLDDYRYHTITFNNSDGTQTTCKFAEHKSGKKGIIPEIEMDLLAARKKYKKIMEEEKDPSLKAVLDGLQLAYKVTANSLYGQCGGSTSAIYMKEIAASTTATGREALQFSKYFIENIFYELVTLALTDKSKYLEKTKEVYQYYPTTINVVDYVVINDENMTATKKRKMNLLANKVHKEKQEYQIHIATDEKWEIPLSKFERFEIGYEFEAELYNDYKSFFDGIKCPNNPSDPKDNFTKNKFYSTLRSLKVNGRKEFYEELYDMIINKKNKPLFYQKFIDFFKKIELDIEEYLLKFKLELLLLPKEKQTKFFKGLEDHIVNMGYSGKDELFEKFYLIINNLLKGCSIKPEIIYGDTDSVFYCPHLTDLKTGKLLKDDKSLLVGIELGIWSSILIGALLPPPMAQEYEKVYKPFAIISKKRYVGNLYEKNPKKFYQKSMGIVLKRRDNAPIVKIVCGGIVNQLLNKQSAIGALEFTQKSLKDIITGKYKIDKYVITKTLRTDYADRTRIVHAVLADRMGVRDPGNKPQSNDRIPYAYIETKGKPKLQGDRVETPEFITNNKLKLDYLFYITNQIMKPCLQFLELVIENPEQVFKEYIIKEENRKKCMMPIGYYAKKKYDSDSDETDNETSNSFDDNQNIFEKIITKNDKIYKNNIKTSKSVKITKKKKKEKKIIADTLINPEKYRTHQYNKFYDEMMDEHEVKSNNSSNKQKKKIIKKKVIKRKKPDTIEHTYSLKKYIGKDEDKIDFEEDFKEKLKNLNN